MGRVREGRRKEGEDVKERGSPVKRREALTHCICWRTASAEANKQQTTNSLTLFGVQQLALWSPQRGGHRVPRAPLLLLLLLRVVVAGVPSS